MHNDVALVYSREKNAGNEFGDTVAEEKSACTRNTDVNKHGTMRTAGENEDRVSNGNSDDSSGRH